MDSLVEKSQIDSTNFSLSQQKNDIQSEKKSVSSFQEKNITIQDQDIRLKNLLLSQKEFLKQNSAQQNDKKSISIIQTANNSKIEDDKNFHEIEKQFNDLKFDSNQKIQNASFNKILIKFLGVGIQKVLTFDIKNIIRVQRKLDEHLIYMKNMRNKLLGLSFKEIKRKLWSSSQANLSVQVFKQIVFIAPHFYQTKYSHLVDGEFPYLIRFPTNHAQTEQRTFQFKKLVFSYIAKKKLTNKIQQKDLKEIIIPQMQNDFFKDKNNHKSFVINEQLEEKKVDIFVKKKETSTSFSPFSILDNSSDFKETLYFLIRQKEMKLKQMQKEKITPIQ